MKKKKGMGLSYFGAYLSAVFGGIIPAMLFIKSTPAAAIIFLIIDIIAFGCAITGHVFERKYAFKGTKKLFKFHFYFTACSFIVITLLNLVGFFMEMGLTLAKQPAPYAWMVTSIGIVIMIVVNILYIKHALKEKVYENALADLFAKFKKKVPEAVDAQVEIKNVETKEVIDEDEDA